MKLVRRFWARWFGLSNEMGRVLARRRHSPAGGASAAGAGPAWQPTPRDIPPADASVRSFCCAGHVGATLRPVEARRRSARTAVDYKGRGCAL